MGWLFYRSKVLIRKRILLHVERIARKLHKRKKTASRFPLGLCRGFVSLLGWITHSETYDWYLIHIKELVNVRKIKRIISKMTREVNRHAGMEKKNSAESSLKPFRSLEKVLTFRDAISLRMKEKTGTEKLIRVIHVSTGFLQKKNILQPWSRKTAIKIC